MKIKICGLYRNEDIDFANEALPDYIGFVLNFPKSHRNITLDKAEELKKRLDPKIKAVGVFVDADFDYIGQAAERKIIDIIQLHGNETEDYIRELKTRLSLPVIKSVEVGGEEIRTFGADFLLLDSGKGTGKQFDRSLIRQVPTVPFFIAGGITPENICETAKYSPFGVDISSGVETDGKKDRKKMLAAVKAARAV